MGEYLTHEERSIINMQEDFNDIIGEAMNIAMGKAATTLSSIISSSTGNDIKVYMTTPSVTLESIDDIKNKIDKDSVCAYLKFKSGIKGNNLIILSMEDASVIVNLMFGNKEPVNKYEDEMITGAISEVMNQMVGASTSILANLINTKIDILPPISSIYKINEGVFPELKDINSSKYVKVSFVFEVEGYISSSLIVLLDITSATFIIEKFKTKHTDSMKKFEPELHKKIEEYYRYLLTNVKDECLHEVKLKKIDILDDFGEIDVDTIRLPNISSIYKEFNEYCCYECSNERDAEAFKKFSKMLNHMVYEYIGISGYEIKEEFKENLCIENKSMSVATIESYEGKIRHIVDLDLFKKYLNIQGNIKIENNAEQIKELNKKEKQYINSIMMQVPFNLSAVIDSIDMPIKDALKLNVGSTIQLSKKINDFVDIYIGNVKKGEGQVMQVAVDNMNYFAIKITSIYGKE